MKGDDPEIDTAQTPKRFDERLAPLERIRKTFTDSIPNKLRFFFRIAIWTILVSISGSAHTMPAHFESGEKYDGSKVLANVHTILEEFEKGRKFECNGHVAISARF